MLDIELLQPQWKSGGRGGRAPARESVTLAEATVARRSDFGRNDRTTTCTTHLGHLLKPGDLAWGFCAAASQLGTDAELTEQQVAALPEV